MKERKTYTPQIIIPYEKYIRKVNSAVVPFVRAFIISTHCRKCPIGINVCDPRFDGKTLSGQNLGYNECLISQNHPIEVSEAALMDITQPFWRSKI